MTHETISSLIDSEYQVESKTKIPDWIVNEAFLINDALKKGTVSTEQAQAGRGEIGAIFENREILDVMKGLVQPCFFIEYPPENLNGKDRGESLLALFTATTRDERGNEVELGEYLGKKGYAVSIAMSSLDSSTAEAVRYLNEKNVPVVAWVVVEDLEGYWTNKANIPETTLKTDEILNWATENNLRLKAVGFDSEKPVQLLSSLAKGNIVELTNQILDYTKKTRATEDGMDPQQQFDALIQRLRENDIETEIYSFPRGLKGLLGGIGIDSPDNSRIIEMVYTNGMPTEIQRTAFKLMRSKDAIPAFGVMTGNPEETPGRDFSRVAAAAETGKPLSEIPKGKLPKHLGLEDLDILLDEWLNQEIDLNNRTFKVRELYLFAMNDARMATMLAQSINIAFRKQEEKSR